MCRVHGYTVETKTRGAYGTDCSNWPNNELLFFWAVLRNVDDQATSFNLRHFVLASRDGRTFGPVNVRSQADSPPNFLPETGKVPPRSNIAGYLTFDDRVAGVIAARLSYVSKDQTLTIVFDGKHVVS